MSICILGFVFSLRSTFVCVLLAPTIFRVVVLALVLVLSVLSLLSLLTFAFALAVLAFALFALAFCQMHRCPLGRLLLRVMNISVSRFVHLRDFYTHSMF